MTFKRFLGIGIATIIYWLCAVGWAEVKPIDPLKECLSTVTVDPITAFGSYKQYGTYLNGRYVMCFDPKTPQLPKIPVLLQSADSITEGGALTGVGGDSSLPSIAINDTGGGSIVGGPGVETVAMNNGGLSGSTPSPQPSPAGGEGELIVDEAQKESGTAAAMTGGAVNIRW